MRRATTVSRRQFLRRLGVAGLGVAVTPAIAACQAGSGNSGAPEPSNGETPDPADLLGEHFGEVGTSFYASKVENDRYFEYLQRRTSSVTSAYGVDALSINTDLVLDLGGLWANDLALLGRVDTEEAVAVLEVAQPSHEPIDIESTFAYFLSYRFLDIGASRDLGVLAIGHADRMIVYPNLNEFIDAVDKDHPDNLPNAPLSYYLIDTNTSTRVEILASREGIPVIEMVQPRGKRITSYLDQLTVYAEDGAIAYLPVEEQTLSGVVQPHSSYAGVTAIEYSKAVAMAMPRSSPNSESTSGAGPEVDDAPNVPRQDPELESSLMTYRTTLEGEPPTIIAPGYPPLWEPGNYQTGFWGNPEYMPFGYKDCGQAESEQICHTCVASRRADANLGVAAGLATCLIGAAIANIFSWLVAGACAAIAAGFYMSINIDGDSALEACGQRSQY